MGLNVVAHIWANDDLPLRESNILSSNSVSDCINDIFSVSLLPCIQPALHSFSVGGWLNIPTSSFLRLEEHQYYGDYDHSQ